MGAVLDAVFDQQFIDARFVGSSDFTDNQILVRCQPEFAAVLFRDRAQAAEKSALIDVANATAFYKQAVVPCADVIFLPAIDIAVSDKRILLCRLEDDARPTFNFTPKPVDTTIFYRVFQACVLAVCAITVLSLRCDDSFRHCIDTLRSDETKHIAEAWKRVCFAMGHSHAAAHRDVKTINLAVFHDRN